MKTKACVVCGTEFAPRNSRHLTCCTPCRKAYMRAYRQTPEYNARHKAYQQTPEYKAYMRAYRQTPEYKARDKARDKARHKVYQQTPEYKARHKAYRQTPEYKCRQNARRRRWRIDRQLFELQIALPTILSVMEKYRVAPAPGPAEPRRVPQVAPHPGPDAGNVGR